MQEFDKEYLNGAVEVVEIEMLQRDIEILLGSATDLRKELEMVQLIKPVELSQVMGSGSGVATGITGSLGDNDTITGRNDVIIVDEDDEEEDPDDRLFA